VRVSGHLLGALFSANPASLQYTVFHQADGGRQTMDDRKSERQNCTFLLLRRCGIQLRSLWPLVHLGVSAARVPIVGKRMAITHERRMATNGQALRWTS